MSSPHHFLELLCVVVLIFWWLGLKVYKQSALSESRTSRITIRLLSTIIANSRNFSEFLSCTQLYQTVTLCLYFVIPRCILSSKLYHVSCIFVSCLMCSTCQPSPHLNCLLNIVAMAKVLYAYSLDLMEAYRSLNVGSPRGAPQP